jgi:hypothetical protein
MKLKDKMIINDHKVREFEVENTTLVFVDKCLYSGTFDEACQGLRKQQAIEMGFSKGGKGNA